MKEANFSLVSLCERRFERRCEDKRLGRRKSQKAFAWIRSRFKTWLRGLLSSSRIWFLISYLYQVGKREESRLRLIWSLLKNFTTLQMILNGWRWFFFCYDEKKDVIKTFSSTHIGALKFQMSHKCRRWIFQWLGKKWRTERQRPIICSPTAHARVRRRWGDSMTPTPVRLPAALETLSSEKSFKEINDFHRPPRQEEEINSWMEVSVERRATTKKNLRDKAKAEKWNKTQIYEPPGK